MGHVYRPNNPTFDAPFDPKRCAASVAFGGRSVGFHQCRRPGVIQDGGHLWCKGHAPATVKAKRAAQEAKWKAASDARKAERDTIESLRARCARLEARRADLEGALPNLIQDVNSLVNILDGEPLYPEKQAKTKHLAELVLQDLTALRARARGAVGEG